MSLIRDAQQAFADDPDLKECRLVLMRGKDSSIPALGGRFGHGYVHLLANPFFALTPHELAEVVAENIRGRGWTFDLGTTVGIWRYGCRHVTPRLVRYHVAFNRDGATP